MAPVADVVEVAPKPPVVPWQPLLFTIPFGRLADRIGRKPVLYLGLIPNYAWLLLFIYCPSPE